MSTEINNKLISIPINKYIEIVGCDSEFKGSSDWDEEHGLEIASNTSGLYEFKFKITDPHKFFLAQIKYGL